MNKEFSNQIVESFVKPQYVHEIKSTNKNVDRWSTLEFASDYLNTTTIVAAALLAFASINFKINYLMYISGSFCLISLIFNYTKNYAKKQYDEGKKSLDTIYQKLNVPLTVSPTIEEHDYNTIDLSSEKRKTIELNTLSARYPLLTNGDDRKSVKLGDIDNYTTLQPISTSARGDVLTIENEEQKDIENQKKEELFQ